MLAVRIGTSRHIPRRRQVRRPLRKKQMTFAHICLFLGVLFAFATLILKVVEVARSK
jgi:hypothetical protein